MRRELRLLAALLIVLVLGAPASVRAAGSGDARSAGTAVKGFELKGFRSARFGMTEAEVKTAIEADFRVKPAAIRKAQHPIDRTQLLSVTVPDLLPHGGKADITYVLGYSSHRLIQVVVIWSSKIDPAITPEILVADADLLRTTFERQGYQPGSITMNAATTTGSIVAFRGSDAGGHMTTLMLSGTIKIAKTGAKTLLPDTLALYYMADPKNPDVYRLPAGKF